MPMIVDTTTLNGIFNFTFLSLNFVIALSGTLSSI